MIFIKNTQNVIIHYYSVFLLPILLNTYMHRQLVLYRKLYNMHYIIYVHKYTHISINRLTNAYLNKIYLVELRKKKQNSC